RTARNCGRSWMPKRMAHSTPRRSPRSTASGSAATSSPDLRFQRREEVAHPLEHEVRGVLVILVPALETKQVPTGRVHELFARTVRERHERRILCRLDPRIAVAIMKLSG